MCIKSCKSSPLLRPTPPLNPKAEEWRPTRLNHIPSPPHKLLWHIPPQPHCYQYHPMPYFQRALPHFFYHSFPPPPPPIPFSGQGKNASEKSDCSIVKQGQKSGVSKPPKNKEASHLTHHFSSSSSRTTVMLRNIPNQLRREFMLEFLDSYCTSQSLEYDFMYLPMDFRSKDNLGYAFVNFTKGGDALKFKKIVQGFKWGPLETDKGIFTSRKICAITWARIQGKERLVKRFESSTFRCDNPEFLPAVFDPPRGGTNATSPVVVGRLINQARS
ncbi:protein terminal ear1 homolog [Salvia hispanica]|uniref:protein terminal ear1 homolog n=1 Tax=Salvia hispanica TaxID=49212 RepID=UPI002009591D|nr:protein terminal ear1 homolog [Salvia hispanica]